MSFSRIYRGLDALDARGAPALEAARQGFLEWAFALDDAALAPEEARDALDRAPTAGTPSPAARAFLGFLGQAANTARARPVRRGGRRRMLN